MKPLRRGQGTGGGQSGAKSPTSKRASHRGGSTSPKSNKWREQHSEFQKMLKDARRAEAQAPPRPKAAVREEKFAMGGMGGGGGKIGMTNECSADNPFAFR